MPAPKPADKDTTATADDYVIYVATGKEPLEFAIPFNGVDAGHLSPSRDEQGRVQWLVPVEVAERFERHHFVQTGRIVRKKD